MHHHWITNCYYRRPLSISMRNGGKSPAWIYIIAKKYDENFLKFGKIQFGTFQFWKRELSEFVILRNEGSDWTHYSNEKKIVWKFKHCWYFFFGRYSSRNSLNASGSVDSKYGQWLTSLWHRFSLIALSFHFIWI